MTDPYDKVCRYEKTHCRFQQWVVIEVEDDQSLK
jgi:hypothetical protein